MEDILSFEHANNFHEQDDLHDRFFRIHTERTQVAKYFSVRLIRCINDNLYGIETGAKIGAFASKALLIVLIVTTIKHISRGNNKRYIDYGFASAM